MSVFRFRFETKLCRKATKCAHCSEQTLLGYSISICKECHLNVHPRCAHLLPKTCGLPKALVKHYAENCKRQIITDSGDSTGKRDADVVADQVEVEGWVKVPV